MRRSRLGQDGENVFQIVRAKRTEAQAKGVQLIDLSIGEPRGPALLSAARPVRPGGLGRADQTQELGAPWAQTLDRGGQEAATPQRAGDCARQQARWHRLECFGSWAELRGE